MEYQIELAPIQIQLNSEMYQFINQILDINLSQKEIKDLKSRIEILDVDEKKCLTKIKILYPSSILKPYILKKTDSFLAGNSFESHLQPNYLEILKSSQTQGISLESKNFFDIYIEEMVNTLLIDIFSEHFTGLVHYIIKMAIRDKYSSEKTEILSVNILNEVLNFKPDYVWIKKYLHNQYWISSRHLFLVSNDWTHLDILKQESASQNDTVIKWLLSEIPDELKEKLELYLHYLKNLQNYKILDAQIQVRSAYLLKIFLNRFIQDQNFDKNFIWDIKESGKIVKSLLNNYKNTI